MAQLIAEPPSNGQRLMSIDPATFIAVMHSAPSVPVCLVPGNDRTHGSGLGDVVATYVRDCEGHRLAMPDQDVDFVPADE